MLNRKFTFIYLLFSGFVTLFFFSSNQISVLNSGGRSSGNCASCHSGTPNTDPNGGVTITGLPTSYTPNTAYTIKFCLTDTDASLVAGGFAMNHQGVGTWSNIDATFTELADTYVRHSQRNFFGNDADEGVDDACWDLQWNAPAASSGDVNFLWAANAVNNANGNGGDHGGYNNQGSPIVVSEGVLPVDLTAFNAITRDEKVQLNWSTAQEINSDYFQIERSKDGKNYEAIGDVKAALNSSKSINYEFEDNAPIFNETSYYRLRQVDIDGSFEYSPVRSVKVSQSLIQIAKLYPNPVFQARQLNVVVNNAGEANNAAVVLTDVLGHAILQQEMSLEKGENALQLDLSEVAKGQYFLAVKSNQQRLAQEMVVVQ